MPHIYNPTRSPVYSPALDEVLIPGEVREVHPVVAREACRSGVLRICNGGAQRARGERGQEINVARAMETR